jgi:hypothetical protein
MMLIPAIVCALSLGAPPPEIDAAATLRAEARTAVKNLIPVQRGSVDIMVIAMSPRANALAKKLQTAVAENQAWFQEQVKRSKPGKPLPYNPKLGLTSSEYEEFLRIAKKKALTKTGEAPLSVVRQGKGRYQFSAKGPLAALDGITIDLPKSQVETSRGNCDKLDRVESPKDHPFPWDGYVWETITPIVMEKSTGRVTQFHIGQLRGTRTGIIYYKSLGFEKGKQQPLIRLMVTYPLRKPSNSD